MSNNSLKTPPAILSVNNLAISIKQQKTENQILKDISFNVPKGQTVALVGETGSGKSLAAYSILKLLPGVAKITAGSIIFDNQDLLTITSKKLRHIRGNKIGMIFQEPGTSLNPLMQIGKQIDEPLRVHQKLDKKTAKEQVLSLMELVGIPDPRRRYNHYPYQLSGGVKQRAVIAMALACKPMLLLADEPTSALDTTVQAQILDLLSRLIKDLSMSVLLISHDLSVVASIADRVLVMHGGYIVERGTALEVLNSPAHPYTRDLLARTPNLFKIANRHSINQSATCPYAYACKHVFDSCSTSLPSETTLSKDRTVRCFLYNKKKDNKADIKADI